MIGHLCCCQGVLRFICCYMNNSILQHWKSDWLNGACSHRLKFIRCYCALTWILQWKDKDLQYWLHFMASWLHGLHFCFYLSHSRIYAHMCSIYAQYLPAEDYISCFGWDSSSSCRMSLFHIKWLIFKQHPWLLLLQYLSVATSFCFSDGEL